MGYVGSGDQGGPQLQGRNGDCFQFGQSAMSSLSGEKSETELSGAENMSHLLVMFNLVFGEASVRGSQIS